jgi:TolB-like protein/DNA-binding winged helix-turn-helix (wHTH) protein
MQPPLTPGNGTTPPRFRIDDLEVDVGKAEVKRGDERIALPKLSFDLLLALINAAPSIVTNDDLLQQVWPGLLVSPESVAQRVKLLRSAIGDDSQQPRYILGVRGRGYRLIPVPDRIAESRATIGDAGNPSVNKPSPTTVEAAGQGSAPLPSVVPPRVGGAGKRVGAAAAVLVAVGVVVAGWHYWSSDRAARLSTVAMVDKSIAVLPFVDMSEKKDQEYFADGMAEEIINLLVKVPGLKVISRTSSFQFKGKTEDLRNIGSVLGVAYVLEGSVRKSGDHLRVTAQLIDSKDGTNLLSQTYDRDLIDVLKMQDEIAANLVRSLQVEVTFSDSDTRPQLRNAEAYTLFLQGMHAAERFDQHGLEQSLSDFQRALDLDPAFVPAAVGIAGAYSLLGEFLFMPAPVAFEQSRRAAEHALKLDPNVAIAHALLASTHLVYDQDWPAADRELKVARALAPKDMFVLSIAVDQALVMGHWEDALKLVNSGLDLDPLGPGGYYSLSWIQVRRGRLAEAETAMRHTLEISPTFSFAHYYLGLILLARGQLDAALAEFLKEVDDGGRLAGSTRAYLALGRKADSDAALAETLKDFPNRAVGIAGIYAFRGELDEAFKWLERAYVEKDASLYHIKSDPQFLSQFQSDPRFKALLKKMNLPE